MPQFSDAVQGIIRLNPLIQPILNHQRWELPEGLNEQEFIRLKSLQLDAVEQADVELIDRFGDLWLLDQIPNQPIRCDRDLNTVLGFGRFSDGEKSWLSW